MLLLEIIGVWHNEKEGKAKLACFLLFLPVRSVVIGDICLWIGLDLEHLLFVFPSYSFFYFYYYLVFFYLFLPVLTDISPSIFLFLFLFLFRNVAM